MGRGIKGEMSPSRSSRLPLLGERAGVRANLLPIADQPGKYAKHTKPRSVGRFATLTQHPISATCARAFLSRPLACLADFPSTLFNHRGTPFHPPSTASQSSSNPAHPCSTPFQSTSTPDQSPSRQAMPSSSSSRPASRQEVSSPSPSTPPSRQHLSTSTPLQPETLARIAPSPHRMGRGWRKAG